MSDREKGGECARRRGQERESTVALFPERSRLSWPQQSQSPQPRKTNGGKSQPGGFDSLKAHWDLINMQLFLCVQKWEINACSEMCVARVLKFTQAHEQKHVCVCSHVDMIFGSLPIHKDVRVRTAVHTCTMNPLAKEVKAIKISSWLLTDCNSMKNQTFTTSVPCMVYVNVLCRHFRHLSRLYVWLHLPPRSPSYCMVLTHTAGSPPPPCSRHPIPEDGATREKLIEI